MSDLKDEGTEELQMVQPSEVPEESIESLRAALAEEKKRAEQYLANWQRAQADYINFKRRTEQEQAENTRRANAALLLNLLPVVDDFERALAEIRTRSQDLPWVEGIELIYRKFLSRLENEGVRRIAAKGKDFDPRFHEAVLYEDGEEGKVIEELEPGYLLGDWLLRPAMVKVGKGNPALES